MPTAGRPLVAWSVEAFAAAPSVTAAVIAAPPGHESEVEAVAVAAGAGLALTVVTGGATRAESVGAGLAAVESELVAVHDAARPLVTAELIETLVRAVAGSPDAAGAIAASPIADTVKRVRGGGATPYEVERTERREALWGAQTPQVFRTDLLRSAHEAGDVSAATDDAMLIEQRGGTVLVHPSPGLNPKVTTPADLRMAELLLGS